jgi:hypothetical protein
LGIAGVACTAGLAVALRGHGAEAQIALDAQIPRAQIEALLERYRDEPSVDALVRAVIATSVFDPGRARDAADRARLAGLIPHARADIRRAQALDWRALQGGTADGRTVWATGDDLAFTAGVTLHLGRLVYASEESALLRERRQLEERRFAIITQVVHLYFERRRLQLERDLSGRSDVGTEMRIAEIEALLDVFTNGAFSRMIAEAGRRRSVSFAGDPEGAERP